MVVTMRPGAGLWNHQREAVDMASRYLNASDVNHKSALITMPTGTGKTGVIASIATELPAARSHRLILTPWNALVIQLIDDLRGRFWRNIPEQMRPPLLPVKRLPPSSQLAQLPDSSEPAIFVATIAAISVAAKRANAAEYGLDRIFQDFACVLVDEGHYEPALDWSQAIRSLNRRTILLTATPYRNDDEFFQVGDEWRYRYPHWKAEEERFLRAPDFIKLDDATAPEKFASKLIEHVDTRFPGDDSVRVIVRCETATSIRGMTKALENLGQTVIGIHERFGADTRSLCRSVPRPDECTARFWVHQNKLIEGIDDPTFKVLALYESLKNDRAIVQQIGRILRNPTQDPDNMAALVISRGDRDIARIWHNYRAFDHQDEAESVATLPQLVGQLLSAQPAAFYYDGGYRTRSTLLRQMLGRSSPFRCGHGCSGAEARTP